MKDNTKHTPGPWEFGEKAGRLVLLAEGRGTIPIAYVGGNGQERTTEKANGRLMAAAPDLAAALAVALEALRLADDALCKIGQASEQGDDDGVIYEAKYVVWPKGKVCVAANTARAAMEKAGAA
jgi:hypothetical protein